MQSVDASIDNSYPARDGANNTITWMRFEKICPSTLLVKEPIQHRLMGRFNECYSHSATLQVPPGPKIGTNANWDVDSKTAAKPFEFLWS
jgi:hypothetical protein